MFFYVVIPLSSDYLNVNRSYGTVAGLKK